MSMRRGFENLLRTRGRTLAVLAGGVSAALTLALLRLAAVEWPIAVVAASAAGFVAVSATVAVLMFASCRRRSAQVGAELAEVQAYVAVRPLLGDLPPPVGGWAIDALFAERLAATLERLRPRVVVECGAGTSTLLIAACLQRLGEGALVSLEHDSRHADSIRRALALRGTTAHARVVTAPFVPTDVHGETYRWYESALTAVPDGIDLLVIDGPPGPIGPRARYPAVPVLRERLSPGCVVLMDDGARDDETWIAHRWAELLGARAYYDRRGKGAWILDRRPEDEAGFGWL